jgi:hypothetical protein
MTKETLSPVKQPYQILPGWRSTTMLSHVSHVHELLGILWRQGFGWHKFWLVTTTIVVNGFIIVVKGFIVVNGFVIVFETLAQEL